MRMFFSCLSVILFMFSYTGEAVEFEHVMTFGAKGTGPGQFMFVEDFAIDSKGHLLVSDAAHGFIQAFDPKTGEYITRFGGKGDNDFNLEKPEGISVAPNGDIYIADYLTGEVKIYNPDYELIKIFSGYGSAPGQNIKSEFTDIYNDLYYMPEAGNHRISVWDLDGNFQFTFCSFGSEPGQLNNPEASKFNSAGKLYVSDLKNDRIQVFSPKGKFLQQIGTSGSAAGQLIHPAGIGIDKDDNIYVGEIGNNRIQVFSPDGAFIAMFGEAGTGTGQFGNIHGVFVDKTTSWIYVADTANNRVQVFQLSKDIPGVK